MSNVVWCPNCRHVASYAAARARRCDGCGQIALEARDEDGVLRYPTDWVQVVWPGGEYRESDYCSKACLVQYTCA